MMLTKRSGTHPLQCSEEVEPRGPAPLDLGLPHGGSGGRGRRQEQPRPPVRRPADAPPPLGRRELRPRRGVRVPRGEPQCHAPGRALAAQRQAAAGWGHRAARVRVSELAEELVRGRLRHVLHRHRALRRRRLLPRRRHCYVGEGCLRRGISGGERN
jgi:hypothetical protein